MIAQKDTWTEALYLANAVMFRTLLHVFVVSAGESKNERAAFQKGLFDQIMKDIKCAKSPREVQDASAEIVMGIFGISGTRDQPN